MLTIQPIATFKAPFATKFGVPRQSGLARTLRGEIHFLPEFRNPEALRGIEGFQFLWLIWGFSGNRPRHAVRTEGQPAPATPTDGKEWSPLVRPPRLGGNKCMGVFATRSPFRPNPLGLSSVRVQSVDRKAMVIHTLGADLMDGTPIYDIKPYLEYADSHPGAGNGFVDMTSWQPMDVRLTPEARAHLESDGSMTSDDVEGLVDALSQDPRPHYQQVDGQRTYGFAYMGHDIRFQVLGNVLTVISALPVP